MKKIVVTVIGTDQVGIVSGVAKKLAEKNINILDICLLYTSPSPRD